MRAPWTSRRAFSVSGRWWKPAWMMPELALDTPKETSTHASSRATRSSYADSRRAIAAPETPAPMTATS